jgi:leader peptidase (prepilin peptidase)/N-methyltransferase
MRVLNIIVPVFGLFIGSLLNLYIDGLHSESPNVFCPSCRKPAKAWQRIPLLGYLLSGGRCARCKAPVSIRYLLMELAAASICFVFFRKYGLSLEACARALFVLLLVLISFIDVRDGTVPDTLSIGGLFAGFVLAFFRKPLFFYQDALWGILACGGIALLVVLCCRIFIKREVMGLGDITLLCMIGAFCGLKGAVFSVVAGSLFGVLIGMPLMMAKGKTAGYAIPFGPFLSLGALLFMFYGNSLIYRFLTFVSGR